MSAQHVYPITWGAEHLPGLLRQSSHRHPRRHAVSLGCLLGDAAHRTSGDARHGTQQVSCLGISMEATGDLSDTLLLGKPVQDPARKDGSDRNASARACCDEHRSSNARALLRAQTTRVTVFGQQLPASRHQSRWCCSQGENWRKNHCERNEFYPRHWHRKCRRSTNEP
jgi:hypothetical protein